MESRNHLKNGAVLKSQTSRENLKFFIMKKLIKKLLGVKVHANHTAIKGKKSSGVEDSSTVYKHWKQGRDVN
jgi:hypothetical protein